MRANRYLHIAVISATLLFLVLCQTAAAGPPKKHYCWLVPRLLVKIWKLDKIVANQQIIIDQQESQIKELEDMLQNFAAVPQTGQTQSYASGDDGDLQLGVQWLDPRFTDNGDGTVTDHLTGLIWLKDADCFGKQSHGAAKRLAGELAHGQCGLSDGSASGDWHMPNLRELLSLIDYCNIEPALPSGHPFSIDSHDKIWTGTEARRVWRGSDPDEYVWGVGMPEGKSYHMVSKRPYPEDPDVGNVWPVRVDN